MYVTYCMPRYVEPDDASVLGTRLGAAPHGGVTPLWPGESGNRLPAPVITAPTPRPGPIRSQHHPVSCWAGAGGGGGRSRELGQRPRRQHCGERMRRDFLRSSLPVAQRGDVKPTSSVTKHPRGSGGHRPEF